MSETSDFIRKVFGEGDRKRDAGLQTPENIVRFDDILYGEDPKWQSLDVYRPKGKEGELLPVIVSVHGGGWVYGDKEGYQFYGMNLAQRGFAVVNFSYRLAPENKFPAPLEDLNMVMEWIKSNQKEYGFDTGNLFAVGDSAGAHALSLYVAMQTNPDYAGRYRFEVAKNLKLKAVALNCGCYRVELKEGEEDETAKLMKDYLPDGGSKEEQKLISVLNHMTTDYSPVFLMTAEEDFLQQQAPGMEQKLQELNVPYVFRCYEGKTEKLGHVFHLDIRSEAAKRCNDEECEFFKQYICC